MTFMAKTERQRTTSLNYFNGLDLFEAVKQLRGDKPTDGTGPNTDYKALRLLCGEIRRKHDMQLEAGATIAAVAVDENSDKQRRFVDALGKMGIKTDAVKYQWAYVGQVGGQLEKGELPPTQSLAAGVTYWMGLIAGRAEVQGVQPEMLIVTGVFDIYRSLLDFVQFRGGKAVLLFPRSMLDHRWFTQGGLGTSECPIKFEDLEPYGADVFGISPEAFQERLRLPRSGDLADV
jgi:hypothetical protein